MKEAFVYNVRYYNNLVKIIRLISKNKTTDLFGNELSADNWSNLTKVEHINSLITKFNLKINVNDTNLFKLSGLDFEFPQIIEFLPHLTGRHHLVHPKFKQSKNRFTTLVIGIPTIKREKTSYLLETLKSLFDSLNDSEKSEVLVVVMIAEVILKLINLNFIFNLHPKIIFELLLYFFLKDF